MATWCSVNEMTFSTQTFAVGCYSRWSLSVARIAWVSSSVPALASGCSTATAVRRMCPSFQARLEALKFNLSSRQFFPGAPDLAVEILSPNNTRSEMDRRLRDFFGSGTQIAWLIDPDTNSAEGCQSLTQRRLIGPGGELDGEHLLPGFRYPINDLFKDWDWE